MRHVDSRTLIDRGRKAGLGTAEIYGAISSLGCGIGDRTTSQADGNGYIPALDLDGNVVFLPASASTTHG
jgi:hypothetical protein